MNITEALTRLAEESGENVLLVADPNEGLFVVVRFDDNKERLAFPREDHDPELQGDAVALHLISKATNYQARQARKRGELGRATRLVTLRETISEAIGEPIG